MTLLLVLLGCDPAEPTHPEPTTHAAHEEAHSDAGHGDHATAEHGAAGHGDHATVDHRFDDAEKWAEVFDDPARDDWQKPAALIAALNIAPGSTVADIGAGTGYFNAHLSGAVGETGGVLAVDIEKNLVNHMARRAQAEGTTNVSPRLGTPDDPGLAPGEVDLVLLIDTYHHISSRIDYFTRLRSAVRPGGRLVVVDFKPGDIPVGPPEDHRIPQTQVVSELTAAGWTAGESLEILPYQFVQVMHRPTE